MRLDDPAGPGAGRGAGERGQEPGAGQGEPPAAGDDEEGLPAARVAAGGATADAVKDYLRQIGRVRLLTAGQEVELARRIEAGLLAGRKLAASQDLAAGARADLEQVSEDGR